jgi:hypothetical protein
MIPSVFIHSRRHPNARQPTPTSLRPAHEKASEIRIMATSRKEPVTVLKAVQQLSNAARF